LKNLMIISRGVRTASSPTQKIFKSFGNQNLPPGLPTERLSRPLGYGFRWLFRRIVNIWASADVNVRWHPAFYPQLYIRPLL
jgi:hypothetical protein